MFARNRGPNSNFVSFAVATVLLITTFALIGYVALTVLTGNSFSNGSSTELPVARSAATPLEFLAGTPDVLTVSSFTDKGLGFGLQYPSNWQKRQNGLELIVSPSTGGLDPSDLQDVAIWFGIPPDNTTDIGDLLIRTQTALTPDSQLLDNEFLTIGDQPWQAVKIRFTHPQFDETALATIAATNRNDVGYYLVAVAPAARWPSIEPEFQAILNSFHFTADAVLRPTDATPPPTPTATPTPVIYVVQSGDTLLKISLLYGVDVETLATRNGIDDPRSLRTGTKLFIPIKRR